MPWPWPISAILARLRAETPLGQRGEKLAAKYLRRKGYKIVAQGDRTGPGELDLVVVDGQTIVFVEVKTRRSSDVGHPAEAVTPDKQRRMTRLALAWLKRHRLLESSARFDVVAITWPDDGRKPTIEHYENAFETVGSSGLY